MTNTAIGYCRVSTAKQAGEDKVSLAEQQRAITARAASLNLQIARWFIDAGASGGDHNRPEFQRMVEYCQSQRTGGLVLVLNESRFSRAERAYESAYWRHVFDECGWQVRLVDGHTEGDAAPIVQAVHAGEARKYRLDVMRRARDTKRSHAQQGHWTGKEPFGYSRQRTDNGATLRRGERKPVGSHVRLVVNEEEAALVRWAFEKYAAGTVTLRGVAKVLTERSARRWSATPTAYMLSNRTYLGCVVADLKTAEEHVTEGAHEAIVSQQVFDAVQRRLPRNRNTRMSAAAVYLLSGVMRCAHCGGVYVGGGVADRRGNKSVPKDRTYFYREQHTCGARGTRGTIMRHLIEEAVVAEVGKALSTAAVQKAILNAIDAAITDTTNPEGARKALASREKRAETRRANLVESIADGALTKEEAAPALAKVRDELSAIAQERAALERTSERTASLRQDRERLLALATEFQRVAARAEGRRLQGLLLPWLESVSFDKEARELELRLNPVPGLSLPYWSVSGSRTR